MYFYIIDELDDEDLDLLDENLGVQRRKAKRKVGFESDEELDKG